MKKLDDPNRNETHDLLVWSTMLFTCASADKREKAPLN
jgi:hypothetical protein